MIPPTRIIPLTDPSVFSILLEDKEDLKGVIRCKGRCPSCGEPFVGMKRLGFICPDCKTVPRRCYIDLSFKGKRIRIFSDKQGQPLDSYQRAESLLKVINHEIRGFTFDPSKYIKAELEQYWATNLLDRYLAQKQKELAPTYLKDHKRMGRIAKDFFGTKDVRELRKLDLINFKDHCQNSFKWSPKTLKNTMDFFKAFMHYLKNDLEVIDVVPAFPDIEVPEPKFKWLSAKDQVAIFEKVPDEDKPIIAFLMLHGCRPGEARALKCRDVNLENESITISATFSLNTYREKRKGKRSRAVTIPIHPEALAFISDRVSTSLPEAFVFENPRRGGPYSHNAIFRLWNTIREAAGIEGDLRLYDASRHSLASQLVNSGTSIYIVSKMLGHSSTKMTEKYAHHHIEGLRTELSKMSLKRKETVTRLSPEAFSKKK